jgi:hypothetical protein
MIGEKISPILINVEDALIDYAEIKPNFTDKGFRAAIYIFQSAMMDKMHDLFEEEDIPQDIREHMSEICGGEIRLMVRKFTNIDTFSLYKYPPIRQQA